MITIVVVILVMIALSSIYVGAATTITTGQRNSENRLQARYVALSGLNRALAELDGSAGDSAICSHSNAGSEACFGNVDGSITDSRVLLAGSPVANMSSATNTATNAPFNTDSYVLDTGAAGQDGFSDFKAQTAANLILDSAGGRGIPLNPAISASGTYTVRCRPAGKIASGNIFQVYNLRTYGNYKGEVVGFDVYATRVIVNPFDFAAFGDITVTGNGSIYTQSFKSGYPPDPGTTYDGTPDQFSADTLINAFTGQGDLGSNGTISLSGGGMSINGTLTENAGAAVPPPISPTPTGTIYAVNGGHQHGRQQRDRHLRGLGPDAQRLPHGPDGPPHGPGVLHDPPAVVG
jgi:hypothetical protein